MGQLKFEKDFSRKLRAREIEPKAGSWEALRPRLNSEEKGKKTSIWWLGIAASLAGGILIFSLLQSKPVSETPGIVDAPAKEIFKEEMAPRQISQQGPGSEDVAGPAKASVKPDETVFSKENPVSSSKLASIGDNQEASNRGNDQTQRDPDSRLGTKIPEIPKERIAEASAKEVKTGGITDAEVDKLLAEAAEKISAERSARYVSEKIDAKALLLDAQMELELSFREKVFDVLKEGYFKAKTAVVNRN